MPLAHSTTLDIAEAKKTTTQNRTLNLLGSWERASPAARTGTTVTTVPIRKDESKFNARRLDTARSTDLWPEGRATKFGKRASATTRATLEIADGTEDNSTKSIGIETKIRARISVRTEAGLTVGKPSIQLLSIFR
ncbi:hypothetical protein GCM10023226_07320 [Nocardioides nanhaiensis]|uniref:Uncharacterized protein n=1 Tax=Nocardioides nanhaiensis TaxID=1476871 RepID=A0ABP8VUZ2_9ACTN